MRPERAFSELLPLLIHIQGNLTADLSLARLAKKASLSPFHFQRSFKRLVGESPKRYVQRLRLESAAFMIKIRDSSLLEIALQSGFESHESFTRAFRRQFGTSPMEFRDGYRRRLKSVIGLASGSGSGLASDAAARTTLALEDQVPHAAKIRVIQLKPIHLACIRTIGPYELIPPPFTKRDKLWSRLLRWSTSRGGDPRPSLFGIAYDDPSMVNPSRLRFDAGIQISREGMNPIGKISFRALQAGSYAVYSHIGPYGDLKKAYFSLFTQARLLKKHRIRHAPLFEVYRTTHVSDAFQFHHTDIFLPLETMTGETP
jgi:AraC family transcriptional regulator